MIRSGFKKKKTRKCAVKTCRKEFEPRSMTHKACCVECSLTLVNLQNEKKLKAAQKITRKIDQEKKQRLKTRSDYVKDCQKAFNYLVRARDAGKPCICCQKPLGEVSIGGGFDCGHYRSVGSAPHLRFNLDNAHGQRKQCNRYGAGRAVDYRIGLINRIGIDRVEALEANNDAAKWSIDDLVQMTNEFKQMAKGLLKNNA